jgi:hypothetical protein
MVRSMLVLALFTSTTVAKAEEKATSENAARFDALKKLAGDWVQIGKDGKPTDTIFSSIRVTANGSVVQETMMPGTPKEMVTMYHLDGPDLVLTHYCMLGNQPHMKAQADSTANRLVFKAVSVGNLKSEDDNYMSQATIKLVSNDRLEAEWASSKEGKECHKVNFELARKTK